MNRYWFLLLALVSASEFDSSESYTESSESDQGAVEAPRWSGSTMVANVQNLILPHWLDCYKEHTYVYPHTKYNLPPLGENGNMVFFWDLENCLYLINKVKMSKINFFAQFMTDHMGITEESDIKHYVQHRREELENLMKAKRVQYKDPYDFIFPDRSVTNVVSSMKARQWVFTNSNM